MEFNFFGNGNIGDEKTNARFKDWEDNFIEETRKEVESFKIKK